MSTLAQRHPERMLWLGVLTGPVVWTAHLLIAYGLISIECSKSLRIPDVAYHGTALLAAVLTLGALLSANRLLSLAAGDEPMADRRRFMARAGVVVSAGYLLALLFGVLPLLMLPRCA